MPCFNTETPFLGVMASLQPKNFLVNQFRIFFRLTVDNLHQEWQRCAEEADMITASHNERVDHDYNMHVRDSHWLERCDTKFKHKAMRYLRSGRRHRRYYVRTPSGRVLVENLRFLHLQLKMVVTEGSSEGIQALIHSQLCNVWRSRA